MMPDGLMYKTKGKFCRCKEETDDARLPDVNKRRKANVVGVNTGDRRCWCFVVGGGVVCVASGGERVEEAWRMWGCCIGDTLCGQMPVCAGA